MLKSSRNESNKIKKLRLTMKELKAIARKIGVKNYELKKKKTVSSLLLKGKKNIGLSLKRKQT